SSAAPPSVRVGGGPEPRDRGGGPPTGPMLSSGYEPVLEPAEIAPAAVPLPGPDPVLNPAELEVAPEPAPSSDELEVFDAGPLLEGEPEPEADPSGEEGMLHAAHQPSPLVPGVHPELEHTSPMLAVAAGAWSAPTDDRLRPPPAAAGAARPPPPA